MKTLIELYDERAIENVLAPEIFRPEHIVFLCPPEVIADRNRQQKLTEFFLHRGLVCGISYLECSLYKADKILHQLQNIAHKHPDCVIDITGGTDAALFAAGMMCQKTGVPAITYSRKKNAFYNISGAAFADEKPCLLQYTVEDFFLMAGGTLRKGRVDNRILGKYKDTYRPFFRIFMENRRSWPDFVVYMQKASYAVKGEDIPLHVSSALTIKGERSTRVTANIPMMRAFERLGYLKNLSMTGDSISFDFADTQIRTWLRDAGSVLELYIYQICRDLGIFRDVVSSAIVDWDGTVDHDSVSNELDVVATRGVVPLFISCKTCEIKTEALNELAILKDRFGGKGAKAAIVTTENCNAAARHRAAQLGIAVIDLEELEHGDVAQRIRVIMKMEEMIPIPEN